jgi:hypothetical protein
MAAARKSALNLRGFDMGKFPISPAQVTKRVLRHSPPPAIDGITRRCVALGWCLVQRLP